MKNIILFSFLFLMFSCGKNSQENTISVNQESVIPPYDTIAKDSFSVGAVSVDVARRIRMSSQIYQDSLREVQKKLEEEKLANKLKEEKEQMEKKAEADKKKAEEEAKIKKKKDETKIEEPALENQTNP